MPFPAIFSPAGEKKKKKKKPKINKIAREETEQLIELVHWNVPLYDQNSSDYSNASFISMTAAFCVHKRNISSTSSSFLKQASNNGLEWTGAMTDGGGKKKREMHSLLCVNETKSIPSFVRH